MFYKSKALPEFLFNRNQYDELLFLSHEKILAFVGGFLFSNS
jgi:hypothetical protein